MLFPGGPEPPRALLQLCNSPPKGLRRGLLVGWRGLAGWGADTQGGLPGPGSAGCCPGGGGGPGWAGQVCGQPQPHFKAPEGFPGKQAGPVAAAAARLPL